MARFARVYPLFALVVIATAAINLVTGSSVFRLTPEDVVPHLLLAGAGPTIWTISVEFQFYALFIGLWAIRGRGWFSLPALLLLAAVLAGVAFGFSFDGRINLARYLFIFVAGMALAKVTISYRWAALGLPVFAAAYVAGGVLHPVGPIYDDPFAVLACLGLLACSIHAPSSLGGKLLSRPVAYWLGEVSFGIYLLHRLAQRLAGKLIFDEWLRFEVVLVLTLAAAGVAHIVIERPSRGFLRRALEARKKTRDEAAHPFRF